MLISSEKEFIFVHVYKVAGESIRKALLTYSDQLSLEKKLVVSALKVGSKLGFPVSSSSEYFIYSNKHVRALDIRQSISKEKYEEYFKFAFVRNPWDWQVSLFHYMKQTQDHHQNKLVKNLTNFDDYIEWRVNEEVKLQKSFLVDEEGKVIVDFIGRIETIQKDFSQICSKLNLGSIKLPNINQSKRSTYQDYYSAKSKELIYSAFKDDIDLFGYSFEGYSEQPIIA